jgi:hypothetical protein
MLISRFVPVTDIKLLTLLYSLGDVRMSNETTVVEATVVAEPVAVATPVVETVVAEPVVAEPVAVTPVVEKPKRVRKPKAVVEPVVEPVKVTRTRKAKVVKVGRGRPAVYTGDLLKSIVKLLKKHKNATHVRAILQASGKKQAELVALREASGLKDKVTISMPTLLKIKADAGIVGLGKGRPALKKAA